MAAMCVDHRQQPSTRQPGAGLALLLAMALMLPLGGAAMAVNKPTTVLKPPVQSAATGNLKTTRQALLKQRTSLISPSTHRPGKIVGVTTRPPKTIVTKRFLPK
jgi:hypothetical protein